MVQSVMIISTPVMFLMSIVYAIYLVGPSAIAGCIVIFLFYPLMGLIASASAKIRLKVVTITDKRVRASYSGSGWQLASNPLQVTMMDEIINSIRLIKMYAWEAPFIKVGRALTNIK